MSQPSEWVSLGEAAALIGVHPATIRNWAERGELPFQRTPGGHRRFRRSDLNQWLESHRLTHPSDAQMVVQNALGRARLETANREKLAQLAWYARLDENVREAMRRQGLHLMNTLMEHLTHPENKTGLETAQEIGRIYGSLLSRQNLTLSQVMEGYFYFVDFLLEAVIQFSESANTRPTPSWVETLRQVNEFTRATLIGIISIYEQG